MRKLPPSCCGSVLKGTAAIEHEPLIVNARNGTFGVEQDQSAPRQPSSQPVAVIVIRTGRLDAEEIDSIPPKHPLPGWGHAPSVDERQVDRWMEIDTRARERLEASRRAVVEIFRGEYLRLDPAPPGLDRRHGH